MKEFVLSQGQPAVYVSDDKTEIITEYPDGRIVAEARTPQAIAASRRPFTRLTGNYTLEDLLQMIEDIAPKSTDEVVFPEHKRRVRVIRQATKTRIPSQPRQALWSSSAAAAPGRAFGAVGTVTASLTFFYDTDALARQLSGGQTDGKERHGQALRRVNRAIARHIEAREDFGFEAVYGGPTRPKDVRKAHEADYRTTAIFLSTDHPDTNVLRVRKRISGGGHDVTEAFVREHWKKSHDNLLSSWSILDCIEIYSVEGSEPQLLAIKTENEFTYYAPDNLLPEWMQPISEHARRYLVVHPYSSSRRRGKG